jgi:RNA polymerase sigma-70 factor, ECF subfamily
MGSAILSRAESHPVDDPERQRVLCSLVESVYPEMCGVAAKYLRCEGPAEALQPAGLVHEAFLRLVDRPSVHPSDRFHVKALLCRQMRRILIEHGRQRAAEHQQLLLHMPLTRSNGVHDVTMAIVLDRLAATDERAAHVIELRVWGGLTTAQIAHVLKVSQSTVRRDWKFGRAWLTANIVASQH